MDLLVRKRRREGVISLTLVLIVVAGWWLWAPHFGPYKAYKKKSELRAVLQAIKPPAGGAGGEISIQHLDPVWLAIVSHAADSGFENAKAHYVQEFARHGFAYKGEKITGQLQSTWEFSAPGHYAASVSALKLDSNRMVYQIILVTTD